MSTEIEEHEPRLTSDHRRGGPRSMTRFAFGPQIRLIIDLFRFATRQRPGIVPVTLLGIVSSALELLAMMSVIPLGILASGRPIHNATLLKLADSLGLTLSARFFIGTFLFLFLLRTGTFILTQICMGYISQKLIADFSTRAFATFVRDTSFEEIHKHQIGHFVTLAGDEANRGSQTVLSCMRLVPVIALFLLYGALLLSQSWEAFLGLALFATLVIVSLRSAFRKSLSLGGRQQQESRTSHTHFIESLNGLRTVRSFTAEAFVIRRYSEIMKQYSWTLFLGEAFANLGQAPIFLAVAMALVAMLLWANNAWLVLHMPEILASIMIFFRLLPVAFQGLENAMRLASNLKAGQNIADMLKAASIAERVDALPDFPDSERITSIEFDRVAFRYTDDTPKILDNFSCKFEAGKSYALTGPSGVGKSSLIDLMLKFYAPQAGAVRINGRDISQLRASSLRRHILLSEQAVRIFFGTILENVQFGRVAGNAEAREALAMVGLDETLNKLPKGADTVLNFQGSNLSGGQRQRVAIARALARMSDVLVMDESTNALDAHTREFVLDSVRNSYHDRILIFVTHDPNVIARVDEVIELRPSASPSASPPMTYQTPPCALDA